MTTSHAAVSSLLAAWTTCACSPDEADAVEAHLRTCETCRADVRGLAEATRSLAPQETQPPEEIRDKVLAATDRPDIPDYARAYAATVSALSALLKELDADDDVTEQLSRLTAADRLVADQLGVRDQKTWQQQADAICCALTRKPLPPELMLARAYETWICARDIAMATYKELPPPPPEHLHAIAGFAASLLPYAAAYRRMAQPDIVVRLVLAGPGGGTWSLPLEDHGVITVEMTMDTEAFCLLMAARTPPRSVDVMIRGDVELGYDLLDAGPALVAR
ncbi:hypothetical protein ALI144C_45980 [Actinosynnema sp. ALI-1.44]|uniref:anti-sigma factor family protein n=1 Tax=Actinosynnema sp. ALI-1.44 TaxID=1933779 RepID=UPI0009D596FA|nr:zf-HC2 domain-containing protein [Actinosynnema sp. ALI-1.44]ONI73266.1 hypothetical protein ALI144C_45980 [Actinosynnema sp. ALI-1.44]